MTADEPVVAACGSDMEISRAGTPFPTPPLIMTMPTMILERTAIRTWAMLCLLLASQALPLAGHAYDDIDFARDIRPILSDNCFSCHGPDENTRAADLRLDTQQGLVQDLGGYSAVVPGDVEASELAGRILSKDSDLRMPPPEANKELSSDEQQLLLRWIEQGAPWQQHWAFQPPVQPAVPSNIKHSEADAVRNESRSNGWARNEIDYFVLQRLDTAKLSPSPDAAPERLLRRLYLDLIGLPPTPAEAEHWLEKIWGVTTASAYQQEHTAVPECDELAYQELVSHLLNSPHYGERWARRWLDLARYADTNGYEKDRQRSIWPYRDWVIQALNNDMPFDQFTVEQLAGDMLPEPTESQKIATGFHRNTMLNEEGGIDPLEFRFHAMTDRVATTGTTWLGLTLGCCQCHTHKYDPISHTEYYQLMALMNNADEPALELRDERWSEQQRQRAAEAAALLKQLPEHWPVAASDETKPTVDSEADADVKPQPIDVAFAEWLRRERANAVEWQTLEPISAESNYPTLTIEPDRSIFASGDSSKQDVYKIKLAPLARQSIGQTTSPPAITALRLEALPDERLPARGPGLTYYEGTPGDFFLAEFTVASTVPHAIASASESYSANRFGKNPVNALLACDGDVQTGWSVDGRQGERHVAVFQLQTPAPIDEALKLEMTFGRHFASSLGRFRISATTDAQPTRARSFPPSVEALLQTTDEDLSVEERKTLFETFLLDVPELREPAEVIRKLRQPPPATTTLVLQERPLGHERETQRHHRGEYLQPAEEVLPGVPAVLQFETPAQLGSDRNNKPTSNATTQAAAQPTTRLEFARWIASPANPLTARVTVNRHWAAFFGNGLVKTLDDFGMQGQSPSHPELLDWLAVEFVQADRWSIKQLHRRIVSSSTYRQSSIVKPEALTVDPQNRLLSFAPRLRLDAEVLRDSLLVAAQRLNPSLYGPPVRPLQPAGVTEIAYGSPKWQPSSGPQLYRRSIYTFIKRTAPFAMFATFDAPSGEACAAQRERSNSPLQALTLLNDVMLVDLAIQAAEPYARATPAEPISSESKPTELAPQLARLFRATLVRGPTSDELQMLEDFYVRQQSAFEANPAAARALLSHSATEQLTDAPEPDSAAKTDSVQRELDDELAVRWASWTAVARALFALDETQVRE